MVIEDPYSQDPKRNNKTDWWTRSVQGLHYAEYKVNEKTRVLVGVRPDCYGTTPEFYKSIDAWINVSDRFVRHQKGIQNMFAPWNEGGQPQIETIFTVLKTLDHLINEQQVETIYIQCDGGTHRAVSMFGFYLMAYEKERAEEINNSYKLVGREHWSNPLEYAQGYIEEGKVPALKIFLDKIKDFTVGSPDYGISLDNFLKDGIGEENLKKYYQERFMKKDLPEAWFRLKMTVKFFFVYDLFKTPIAKVKIWVHKKLNTKQGQFYKKHNF